MRIKMKELYRPLARFTWAVVLYWRSISGIFYIYALSTWACQFLEELQQISILKIDRPWLNQFFSDKQILTLRQPYVLVFQYTEGGKSSHLDNLQGHVFCMQTLSALITDKTQMFLEDDFSESLFHPWYIPLVSYFLVHYLIWLLLSFFIHY